MIVVSRIAALNGAIGLPHNDTRRALIAAVDVFLEVLIDLAREVLVK
jgi:hypothetical protein